MSGKKQTETGMIGADTSFLVDFFKGEAKAVEFMRKHARLIRISELVIYEFLCGNLSSSNKQKFFEATQSFNSVDFNREAAVLASEAYRALKEKGLEAGHADCMIAGSYLAKGVSKIVSRNTKHFSSIPGVDLVIY